MKICYIAHPIGGDVEKNLASLREIVRAINFNFPEVLPFCPYYSDVVSLDDSKGNERNRGIKNNEFLLNKGFIDELWLFGERISNGMQGEIDIAKKMGIKIVSKSENIKEF